MFHLDIFHSDIEKILDQRQDFQQLYSAGVNCLAWDKRSGKLVVNDSVSGQICCLTPSTGEKETLNTSTGHFADIGFDFCGRLIICDANKGLLLRYHEGVLFFFENFYQKDPSDKKNIFPASLVSHSSDLVYFADYNGVYYVLPDSPKIVPAFYHEAVKPVCIAIARSENVMYLSDAMSASVFAYRFSHEGNLVHQITFAFSCDYHNSPPVSIAVDFLGNVYCLSKAGIHIYDDAGLHLGLLHLDFSGHKLCFGGNQNKTLFIGGSDGLYTLMLR